MDMALASEPRQVWPNPLMNNYQLGHLHPVSNAFNSNPLPGPQCIGAGLSMSDGYVPPDLDFMSTEDFFPK